MIYKTYRATNPVRWRDGDGWQVGWRLYLVGWRPEGPEQRWEVIGPEDCLALVSVWGSPEPIFVPEDELEEMPMREEEKPAETKQSDTPCKWCLPPPPYVPRKFTRLVEENDHLRVVAETELATARAEANDLMQRLTESQQEVAKVGTQNHSLRVNTSALERDNQLLERDRDEVRQELAEVKAERDRLAAIVEALKKEVAEELLKLGKERDAAARKLREISLILLER